MFTCISPRALAQCIPFRMRPFLAMMSKRENSAWWTTFNFADCQPTPTVRTDDSVHRHLSHSPPSDNPLVNQRQAHSDNDGFNFSCLGTWYSRSLFAAGRDMRFDLGLCWRNGVDPNSALP